MKLTTCQLDYNQRHPEANYYEIEADPREITAQASDDFYDPADDEEEGYELDDHYAPLRF